jgi:hypothetical protein
MGHLTGKWYWEITVEGVGSIASVGLARPNDKWQSSAAQTDARQWGIRYLSSGATSNSFSTQTDPTLSTFTTGDVLGVALDMDNGAVYFSKSNVWENSGDPTSGASKTGKIYDIDTTYIHVPYTFHGGTASIIVSNFGQDSSFAGALTAQGKQDSNGIGDFYYAPPTGFLALCTQNLPEPTVVPSEHFNTVTYAGDYTTSNSITGVGFSPDFVWIKDRGLTTAYNYSHALFDTVRGAGKWISSDRTNAENDYGTGTTSPFRSFDSDGFTVGQNYNTNEVDPVADYFVSWNWKANGAGVSNTNGTITSTVSANADAGFSIVKYTGTGSAATIGHGLSKAPEMIMVKHLTSTGHWTVYNKDLHASAPEDYYMYLSATNAAADYNMWNDTAPTSSVFSVNGAENGTNNSSYIAYCFHSVEGYSKVGSYTGNGSTDGTFVHCGFRPAYVMVKKSSDAGNWAILDDKRNTYNPAQKMLRAEGSDAEADTSNSFTTDFLSNGFKCRANNGYFNASGGTYIFLAFAESDFKHSNAR